MSSHQEQQQSRFFLPDFCQLQSLFLLILTAELLAIVFSLVLSATPSWQLLGLISMLTQWIVLMSSALICTFRTRMEKYPVWLIGLISYFFIMLSTVLCSVIGIWFVYQNADILRFGAMNHQQWLIVMRNLAIASILGGILLRYFYLQQQYRIRLAAETNARMEALHARIHPHFLFNTLNSIAALVQISPDQAEKAIENLATLMRATLKDMRVMVNWEQEIKLCQRYLELEQLRLGNRLKLDFSIDDVPETFLIPGLILQPLIENSVLHGISRLAEGGVLEFSAQLKQKTSKAGVKITGVEINISNPMPPEDNKRRQGHGIGLNNVEQRLKLLYQQQAKIQVEETEKIFRLTLWIPEHRST